MKWQPIATAPKDGTNILVFPSHLTMGKGGKWLEQAGTARWETMKRVPSRWSSDRGPLLLEPREWQPLRAEPRK